MIKYLQGKVSKRKNPRNSFGFHANFLAGLLAPLGQQHWQSRGGEKTKDKQGDGLKAQNTNSKVIATTVLTPLMMVTSSSSNSNSNSNSRSDSNGKVLHSRRAGQSARPGPQGKGPQQARAPGLSGQGRPAWMICLGPTSAPP